VQDRPDVEADTAAFANSGDLTGSRDGIAPVGPEHACGHEPVTDQRSDLTVFVVRSGERGEAGTDLPDGLKPASALAGSTVFMNGIPCRS
jgi:hypothetical protein